MKKQTIKKEQLASQKTKSFAFSVPNVELPKLSIGRNKPWIEYGKKNDLPQYWQELALASGFHGAIVQRKSQAVYAGGLMPENENDAASTEFIRKLNASGDTFQEVAQKIAYDSIVFGGYAINVIWSNDFSKVVEAYHVPFAKVRVGDFNDFRTPETFYFSHDWRAYSKSENKPIKIMGYAPKGSTLYEKYKNRSAEFSNGLKSQLVWFAAHTPGVDFYPVPSYYGVIPYIETDARIANFHLSNISSGMFLSTLINFCEQPEEEEMEKVARDIKAQLTGDGNAGKCIVNFSVDKDHAPIVQPIGADELDKKFIQLQDTVMQNILSAHSIVSPMLVGIKTEGQLGGASELYNAFAIFQEQVIRPAQLFALKGLNVVMSAAQRGNVVFAPSEPIDFTFNEDTLYKILTEDEMRAMIGYGPKENKNTQ